MATVGSTEKFQLQDKQTQQRLNELEAVRRHYQPELHTVSTVDYFTVNNVSI